ncbi:hypothetical protein AA313_de0207737 [Arthrobotrys entomopaga]|nr:hypothetical protein AA313_de0207737 [Arthrobotrys entomopaga]
MTSLTNSIENFISAVFGIVRNLFDSVFAVLTSIFAVFQTAIVSVFDLGKSFLGFLFSNILILSVLAVALVVYTAVTQRNGEIVSGKGKKNIA